MSFRLGIVAVLAAVWSSGATDGVGGTALVGTRPTPDVVVWVDAPGASAAAQPPAVLEQRQLQFLPHVLAVQVGTRVKFPNEDRVFHNVFSYHEGKRFDLGLYPVGAVKDVDFNQPGLSRIFCNIHPQMAAYVMVVDTPYFAVSDEEGRFAIQHVPQGAYPYHAWRPGGSVLNGTADVGPGAELEVRWP